MTILVTVSLIVGILAGLVAILTGTPQLVKLYHLWRRRCKRRREDRERKKKLSLPNNEEKFKSA